jgi:DNA-binding response OmpR family regulator
MPKLTGIELLKKLRSARMDQPVIMVTGRLPREELAQNPSLQLAATLWKPFAINALLDTVRNLLRATSSLRGQLPPLPAWRSQPSAIGLRL